MYEHHEVCRQCWESRACSIAAQTNQHFAPDFSHEGLVTSSSSFEVFSTILSSLSSSQEQQIVIPTHSLADANGEVHHQVLFPLTQSSSGKKYWKTRPCKLCHEYDVKKLVGFYCFHLWIVSCLLLSFKLPRWKGLFFKAR